MPCLNFAYCAMRSAMAYTSRMNPEFLGERMLRKSLALALSCLFVVSPTFAAILDGDDFAVATSAGRLNDWNMSFFSIASMANMKPGKTATDTRAVDSYNYLSLNYKLDSTSKASMRLPFNFNSQGQDEYGSEVTSDFALNDIHFVYSNYDLGYIGDVDLSGKVKWYLPTSRTSQNQKMISKIRFEGYADYLITRSVLVAYIAKPDIYLQSQTASLNPDVPQYDDGAYVRDPRSTTKQFGLEHFVQFQWDINSMFSLTTKTGFNESWYHTSNVEELEGSHVTALRLGLSLWIRPMRGLSFTLGMSNDTNLNSYRGKDIAFVEPFNTQYSLMTNAWVF